jgi:hypothetical protein
LELKLDSTLKELGF